MGCPCKKRYSIVRIHNDCNTIETQDMFVFLGSHVTELVRSESSRFVNIYKARSHGPGGARNSFYRCSGARTRTTQECGIHTGGYYRCWRCTLWIGCGAAALARTFVSPWGLAPIFIYI